VRLDRIALSAVAAATILGAAFGAAAGDPATKKSGKILQMQTAFNPNLPGAGEGVRAFTKSVKQMSGGELVIKMIEPGRIAPTPEVIDAIIEDKLEAAFTWSGYAAAKAPVFNLFATVPFGPGPAELSSWVLESEGGAIHRAAYEKLGITGIPCGVQGAEGGGWFRGDFNRVEDLKGARLRYGKLPGEVIAKLGVSVVPLPAGEFFWQLQQGKVDGGEMSTPSMDLALGFDKLGLPYYMPGWHQPAALLDFLMRKDKWEALPATHRAQIVTACKASIAWMLGRSPHLQAEALVKMRAAGVTIKPWSLELLDAFHKQTDLVLKDLSSRDADFAAGLTSQRNFIEHGKAWRAMSRVPSAE
jgi:TRAP-type mannitol/chloroaromatic compound transport system substrate-binding protein